MTSKASSNSSLAENVQKSHTRLVDARDNYRMRVGLYPSVMYVGESLYLAAFGWPPRPAQAIDNTLILPREFCGQWGIVMPKPAKVSA